MSGKTDAAALSVLERALTAGVSLAEAMAWYRQHIDPDANTAAVLERAIWLEEATRSRGRHRRD